MKRTPVLLVVATLGAAALSGQTSAPDANGIEFFEKQIRPVLTTRCFVCHSASAPRLQGGLRLDSREGLRKGGNSGPAIKPGNPEQSLLIKALRYTDPVLKMPPGKALPSEVVADFEAWVRMGAPDPRGEAPPAKIADKSREWWSWKRPVRPAVPGVADAGWSRTPIDHFIWAKLAEAKLQPSPAADKRMLIRRATYDLIGLPPAQQEIDDFEKDSSPEAFEKVVDRLLASPQYGVRWARHWMDVARYADTADGPDRFAFSYTYRDWLIRAFNDDLPYDQFVMKQLAADQLPQHEPHDLAALGFITLGHTVPKGEPDTIDDRIDVITRGLLGMTVTCARCHDHKFDPIPTRDYYSLYGILANTMQPIEFPLIAKEDEQSRLVRFYRDGLERRLDALHEFEIKRHAQLVAELRQASWISRYLLGAQAAMKMNNQEIEAFSRDKDFNMFMLRRWRAYLIQTRDTKDPVFAMWHAFAALPSDGYPIVLHHPPPGGNAEIKNALIASSPRSLEDVAKTYGEVLAKFDSAEAGSNPDAEQLRLALRGKDTPTNVPQEDFAQIRGAGGDENIYNGLEGAIRDWEAQFGYRGITPRAMVLQDSPKLVAAHVFIRGNPNNPGIETPPHFLSILDRDTRTFSHGSGRIDLARAIVDPENPLTARVIVNRVWQWHFGRGIVAGASDFGTRGDPPSHPELLDYLATRFRDEGWSIKKLQKWILLSSTYQQASFDRPEARAADPENKLLWRMNRQRLDFESLRDSILFVAGSLDFEVGGLPFSLTAQPAVPRRTAYAYIQRGHLPGELSAFDFAIPESHVAQRFLTTVPQQALFMMNSPFVMEQTKRLMDRAEIRAAKDDSARVAALYHVILGRAPAGTEIAEAIDYVSGEKADVAAGSAATWRYGVIAAHAPAGAAVFTPLRYFDEGNWQPASILPAPTFGNAHLSPSGGMPPDDPALAIVRRWVSPVSGTVAISGKLSHELVSKPEEYQKQWGDGVHARIVLNGSTTLADEVVVNKKVDVDVVGISVKPGDTIDFAVDCNSNAESDGFQWAPVITLKSPDANPKVWDAKKDFGGPSPLALNNWEKLAQALLQTNEFAFVD